MSEEQEAGFTPEEDEIEESSPSENEDTEEQPTDADSEQESEEESDSEEPVEKPNRLNKRFSELTAQRKAAEQRAEMLAEQNRQILERLERRDQPQQPQPQPQQRVPKPGLPPDRYDFGSDQEYQQAFSNYQNHTEAYTRQVFNDEIANRQQQYAQQNMQQQQEEAKRQVGEKLKSVSEKGSKLYPDFGDVAFIPVEVAGYTAQLDNAADIAYYWGQKPEERARIAQLAQSNPLQAAAEITRLDERFASKKMTNAPPPPKKVGSNNQGNVDPDKLPIEEWIKLREAGKIK